MKRFLIFFSLCVVSFSFSTGVGLAQNIGQVLADLKEKMGEITIDRITYNQSIEVIDDKRGKIRYETVAVNEKGESTKTAYEFYISDIDKNALVKKPSGKKFFVSIMLNNKQKFIKYFKDDKFEAYTDNLEILVLGADIAQNVIDLLKTAIPLVKNSEKIWNSATEALTWLQNNIVSVMDKSGTRQQMFSFNKENTNLLELIVINTDLKGVATQEKYNWNVTDLNKNKLNVKISGAFLNVGLEIKNSDKYIRYMKGNEVQNFVPILEIASDDIDHARNIIAAFSTVIDKSKAKTVELKTAQAAFAFIKNKFSEASVDQNGRQQKIDFTGSSVKCTFVNDETDSKGKTVNNQYEFYLTDAEPNVTFRVSGKKILIPVFMTGDNKYIRYTKDNVLQNYLEEVVIGQTDIEAARDIVAALGVAIKGSKEVPMKFTNVTDAMKFLKTNIEGASIGSDQYQLSFDGKTADPFASTYSFGKTDEKGISATENYVFYPYLIDVNSVKVETDGKYLTVNSLIAGRKSFVKRIKNEQSSFISELSIMCFDVKKAKDIAIALRFLSANTTPKGPSFANRKAALDFLKQNIGELNSGGKSIKQKIEFDDNNPCKITLTINTFDEKSKTTEQVYEFTLLDINRQLVDFKPVGSNISVALSCKNKQKLIKAYKNSAQQSFTSDVAFLCNDVNLAKNISEAIKIAVGFCE